jgi:iron complex transport system substrate-binding protein
VGYDTKAKQVTLKSNSAVVFPLVIKDDSLTYTFTKPATKIVSLAPSITEILFSIGAGDLVIGRTKYCTFPAEVASVKSIGTLYEPDLELVLDLEPDMVIAATHMNEEVLNTLSKAKISTLTQASPEKISEIYTLIEQLGKLTNRQYESRALVSSLKGKEDRVKAIVSNIPVASRKNVYYVVGTGKSEYTAGSKTFIHEIMVNSGLKNVASDVEKWSYTLEQLIDHDPEYLIGANYSLETMKDSANYASLAALKNGKFVVVNTDIVSIPGPRVIDYTMKVFIQTFYPQWAKNLNY